MSFLESPGIIRGNDYFTRLEIDDEDGSEFTDRWNTGELLCLASAVQRSGDKNWVSVSRAIKPFGEPRRPSDWYTPKNCALQYSKLLKGVEDFKKKSLPRTERETSEELLVKNLTDKRLTELTWFNQQTKIAANSLKVHMDIIESGEYDDHLDEFLKQIEEHEKREEEDFKEWITKREGLNSVKRLNKCRVPLTTKGKAPTKLLESKRKNSPNPDQLEDTTAQQIADVIKTEVDVDEEMPLSVKPIHIKTEVDASPGLNAILDNKVTSLSSLPSAAAPTSPLLTSLLRNPGTATSSPSSAIVSSICSSPLKESDILETLERPKISGSLSEIETIGSITKSRETSPRNSVPQSPRPTPASSPLLNSLLKSPSTVSNLSSIQVTPTKESSPLKVVSSPQSFFNPSSALATAAAQQLAVATATLPQSHHFFQQQELSENRKSSLQSPPVNSACLSAPTLSKLLEMPPSTPGRLPPLPVVDTPTNPASNLAVTEPAVTQPLQTSTNVTLQNEVELSVTTSPSKKNSEKSKTEQLSLFDSSTSEKSTVATPAPDKKVPAGATSDTNAKSTSQEPKVSFKHSMMEMDDTSQENIDILEAVCESINQAFEKKEAKLEAIEDSQHSNNSNTNKESLQNAPSGSKHTVLKPDKLEEALTKGAETLLPSPDVDVDDKIFESDALKEISDLLLFEDEELKRTDIETGAISDVPSTPSEPVADEERGVSGRKFYKSRVTAKKRISDDDLLEKVVDSTVKQTPKKVTKTGKAAENETYSQTFISEPVAAANPKDSEEPFPDKIPDSKLNVKASEIKSPASKKPRIYEKASSKEKKDLSEDDIPLARRSGRKAKKGRRVFPKSTPVKQEEPKDQYEFTESTEENSVGYQNTNTLCYMPRLKDDVRFEETKNKQLSSQNSDDAPNHAVSPSVDKKYFSTPLRNKPGRPSASQTSSQKNLFASDEERMSDSLTSDDASNPQFGEDKIKKWKTSSDKKNDVSKDQDEVVRNSQRPMKATDSPKKKFQQLKRSPFKNDSFNKKEKKVVASDVEELSTCSRDSEDAGNATTWQREDGDVSEEKDQSANVSVDVEAETNDSRLSSSVTAESDKQMDDVEGYESLQGSITTEFSPLPPSEIKDEKDLSQYEKQDWYHGSSPKSSEPISQSSEESEEYESDNWDNQSVSTNKSTSHSAGLQPRMKRKERESPQYKAWKKAISIVLREASCHKYANVFLQKVTNDVAPGYLSIVNRPMDLSLIKKNIDNGIVKTTGEFHRDMMLMFQNAIMYNSSDHDVHQMAVEMQRDVIQQIQAFLTTQTNDKDETVEPTSSLRGARTAKSQKIYSNSAKSREETERE